MNGRKRFLRPGEIRRILVLQFGPIGDTLFAVPALKALRRQFPAATIVVLASPRAGEVLYGAPYIDLLYVCRSGLDLLRSLFQLRQAGFDLAVGLSNQGSWLAPFFGTPWKAGFPSPLLHLATPGPVKEEPSSHVVEYCLSVVRLLGAEADDGGGLEIWLSEEDHEGAERFLATHRLTPPLVAVHPGGHYFPYKRWPAERYAALADALADVGVKVVVIGGAEDMELASAVAQGARSTPVIAAGKLRLRETAALLARCDLFIGNDSAPLHIAAAVKTPSIGLFGPTSPVQFSPYGPGHVVIYKAFPCSPCFRFLGGLWQYWPRCPRPHCMEAISVEEVYRAALCRLRAVPGKKEEEEDPGIGRPPGGFPVFFVEF